LVAEHRTRGIQRGDRRALIGGHQARVARPVGSQDRHQALFESFAAHVRQSFMR
jgi:hypothetical protein